MTTSPRHLGGLGLTGPHPNPLSDLRLFRPCGASLSLHRFAGRWVILRVSDAIPATTESTVDVSEVDVVCLNVVDGPISPYETSISIIFDTTHGFARRFPAIVRPATFVLDPDGRLVAILDDRTLPHLLAPLLLQIGDAPARGAIDQRDVTF